MTRDEHLSWAKKRALEYVECGDLPQAIASLAVDLATHEGLRAELQAQVATGIRMTLAGHLRTPEKMRAWIEEFQ